MTGKTSIVPPVVQALSRYLLENRLPEQIKELRTYLPDLICFDIRTYFDYCVKKDKEIESTKERYTDCLRAAVGTLVSDAALIRAGLKPFTSSEYCVLAEVERNCRLLLCMFRGYRPGVFEKRQANARDYREYSDRPQREIYFLVERYVAARFGFRFFSDTDPEKSEERVHFVSENEEALLRIKEYVEAHKKQLTSTDKAVLFDDVINNGIPSPLFPRLEEAVLRNIVGLVSEYGVTKGQAHPDAKAFLKLCDDIKKQFAIINRSV